MIGGKKERRGRGEGAHEIGQGRHQRVEVEVLDGIDELLRRLGQQAVTHLRDRRDDLCIPCLARRLGNVVDIEGEIPHVRDLLRRRDQTAQQGGRGAGCLFRDNRRTSSQAFHHVHERTVVGLAQAALVAEMFIGGVLDTGSHSIDVRRVPHGAGLVVHHPIQEGSRVEHTVGLCVHGAAASVDVVVRTGADRRASSAAFGQVESMLARQRYDHLGGQGRKKVRHAGIGSLVDQTVAGLQDWKED